MANKIMRMTILSVLVWTSAQQQCDPKTQYKEGGACCDKCQPGTKRQPLSTCLVPQCTPCDDGEYQDSYTVETKCKLQPYCDPNKNFQTLESKTRLIGCQCLPGFWCSSPLCVTCVPRPHCPPGHQAMQTDNQFQESVCEKCPYNTFANHSSWNNTCLRWRECEHGEEKPGTDTTDRTCKQHRNYTVTIIIVFIVVLVIIALATALYYFRRKNKERYYPSKTEDKEHSLTLRGHPCTQEEGKMESYPVAESQPA